MGKGGFSDYLIYHPTEDVARGGALKSLSPEDIQERLEGTNTLWCMLIL